MALTEENRRVLGIAVADEVQAGEIADQIDNGGNPVITAVAAASPDATDLATAITLVNELKAQFNTLIADLTA